MNGNLATLKRLASVGISAMVVALCAALPARAAAPAIAYSQFAIHYTSNHSVTDARLNINGVTAGSNGALNFTGSLSAGPTFTTSSGVSGTMSPSGAYGWSITFSTGNYFNRTTFSGAIQQESGGTMFMTGTRNRTALVWSPVGFYFTNSGPLPFCSTAYPPIY